ncbi:glycosyltransferase [Spirosoma sp. HMF3257]|uniref:Glycosyltransferase 2-like domain-containing protein n=1 Tax=Spirosoma telluris TaxID=2183553 RepID=A0A327NVK9_9BACT|nr:glycosyltransferase [Spirosoma telluris]RAI78036.1 hypothetical protein HMF3257_35190 [Spirosoma telluris]
MISILTITYNREEYLKIAINSVIAQSFRDFELIIVDDGSTDHTSTMVASYKDVRINYFYSNHIGQLSKIRNIALEKATGDIITFLDSDDSWHPDYLQEISTIYSKQQVTSVISNAFICNETEKKTLFHKSQLPGSKTNLLKHRLINHTPVLYPSCFSFKKSIGLRFNTNLKFGDTDLFLRILALGDSIISFRELVFIRKHDSNISEQKTVDSLFIQAYTEEFITLDYLKANKFIGEILYRKTYSTFLNRQADCFLLINMKSDAWLCYLRSFLKYPLHIKAFAKLFLLHRFL